MKSPSRPTVPLGMPGAWRAPYSLRTILALPCALVFAACASSEVTHGSDPSAPRASVRGTSASPPAGDTQRSTPPAAELDRAAWSAPDLERVISVRDGTSGARLSFEVLLDDLARAEAVFLGETHVDESTHRVELAVYAGLLQRRNGKVVLAMEMFERDVQPALDDYVAGRIDEPAFLARVRPWSNYATAYRPLIELARASHRMVVASNFPAPLRRKLGGDSEPSLDQLSAEERAFAPRELFPETPEYWRRVDNAIRGHAGMMGEKPADDDPRLFDTQSLWDNAMGEACALALDRFRDHAVLHVNGGFHSEYADGTVRQLVLRRPTTRVRTVAIVPSGLPEAADVGGLPVADYVVFAAERARDVDDGKYAVFVPRKLEYRLHLPPRAALAARDPSALGGNRETGADALELGATVAETNATARVPLLIWLADDGESAEDALALWKARLGEESAIAVIEAPYRETQEDLVEGGRWYWPDSFDDDVGAVVEGIAGVWAHVLRHQPVDAMRVVLAGEGTGATVVAATTLLADSLAVRGVAIAPRRFSKLKDFALPLPELRGDLPKVAKSLRVVAAEADREWWASELAEYTKIGLENELEPLASDAWRDELERENAVREALGLPPHTLPESAARLHAIVGDGPRARAWGRSIALEHAKRGELVALLSSAPDRGDSKPIELAVQPESYLSGAKLPRAPGPFGGTTVIVLPRELDAGVREAWERLAADDPLAKDSRFHRMVLAAEDGERALPRVIEELLAKNRKNVLVVPARWCAAAETMRALRASVVPFENRMTIHWRPGLGGLDARPASSSAP